MGKDKKSKKDKKKDHKKRKHDDRASRLEDERVEKLRKAERKAHTKANETPEERNARRLAKKMQKQAKKEEEKELFGFTNDANPFGDPNLTKAFLWKKKYVTQMKSGKSMEQLTKHQLREKQMELRQEIEKVKQRKVEREVEQEQMEEMRLQVEREAMRDSVAGWEEKEEEFHRSQAKKRSEIRIREGREKAIDILAKNINLFNGEEVEEDMPVDLDVELTEPHKIFNGLGYRDLEELRRDIKIYVDLGKDLDYWNALITMCDDELGKARHKTRTSFGLHSSVQKDIEELLQEKSLRQLEKMEGDIERKLDGSAGGAVDVAYWEALQKQLTIFKAKAHLTEFHASLLKKRLKQLKKQARAERSSKRNESGSEEERAPGEEDWEPELLPSDGHGLGGQSDDDFSPVLAPDSDDEDAVDPEEDKRHLEAQRRVVAEQKDAENMEIVRAKAMNSEAGAEDAAAVRAAGMNRFQQSADEMFQRESEKGMEDMDEAFNADMATPAQTYWWHDKYRPRKPRFFNRVKTGFDWNKYNQTHYDKENPPPKIVQGYKFNVFYPDLIDPTVPPKYIIEDSNESMDHCTIRFHAGAPYEDIAFKIVKKEWEFSHKRGFKCVFDRGVLHLYFNFRRYRYRR